MRLLIDRRGPDKDAVRIPCHVLLPFDLSNKDLKVEITYCFVASGSKGHSLVRIVDMAGVLTGERFDEGVIESPLDGECGIIRMSQNQYLATVANDNCPLASIIAESDVF